MTGVLLRLLRCPRCRGALRELRGRQSGACRSAVLACGCSRYPILSGIPILTSGPVGDTGRTPEELVDLIARGREREALDAMIAPHPPASPALAAPWIQSLPSVKGIRLLKRVAHQRRVAGWRRQAAAFLDPRSWTTTRELIHFYYEKVQATDVGDYFAYRFGQPRHLTALSLASIVRRPARAVLDLGCGMGHFTRFLSQRAHSRPVVGIDENFFGLYLASHRIAPEADYICCRADAVMPFDDQVFSVVFCSDAFTYFADKGTSIREMRRITESAGVVILAAMRNTATRQLVPSRGLSPRSYQALLDGWPHCLVSDKTLLERYRRRQGPSLARAVDVETLMDDPLLSAVVSSDARVFRDYGDWERWPHGEGPLGLNPLYRPEVGDGAGRVVLRRMFPGRFYEEENAECKQYLPETVPVPDEVLNDLDRGSRTLEIERLIEQCVVLSVPAQY
jgi:SAM-dependent methyltransferase/uncharacterized protein YbaR (Trm112 family)